MLNNLWLTVALYAYPSLDLYIKMYRRKLKAFKNISIEKLAGYTADTFIKDLDRLAEKAENLAVLKHTIDAAMFMLDEEKRQIVKHFYFEELSGFQIMEAMGLAYNTYRYKKRAALKSLAQNMYILGMTDKRFVEFFDDERLIVNVCEYVLENNLTRAEKAEPKAEPLAAVR